jgi:hypothetical protein
VREICGHFCPTVQPTPDTHLQLHAESGSWCHHATCRLTSIYLTTSVDSKFPFELRCGLQVYYKPQWFGCKIYKIKLSKCDRANWLWGATTKY